MHFTTFPHVRESHGILADVAWDGFASGLVHTEGTKDGDGFCPAVFADGHRTTAGARAVTMIALDVETSTDGVVPPALDDVAERIRKRGRAAVLYTSFSHTPDAPRYRVVVNISHEIAIPDDPDERAVRLGVIRHAIIAVARQLDLADVVDVSKCNAAAFFFFPRCPPGRLSDARVIRVDGEPVDTDRLLERAQADYEAELATRRTLSQRAAAAVAERRPASNGHDPGGSLIEQLRAALPPIEQVLSAQGYRYFDSVKRWLYPGSTTGEPGVEILTGSDGVQRYFSWHGSDPLSCAFEVFGARAHDVVDLVVAYEFGTSGDDRRRGLGELARRHNVSTKPDTPQSGEGGTAILDGIMLDIAAIKPGDKDAVDKCGAIIARAIEQNVGSMPRDIIQKAIAKTLGVGVRAVKHEWDVRSRAIAKRNAPSPEDIAAKRAARAVAPDGRIRIDEPLKDEEKRAVVVPIDRILATQVGVAENPILRSLSGTLVRVQERSVATLHELVAEQDSGEAADFIPAPPITALVPLSGTGIAMAVEEFVEIERNTKNGQWAVALESGYCTALNELPGSAIPTCIGVQTLPLVLPRRTLFAEPGYSQALRLWFHMNPSVVEAMPKPDQCTVEAARRAYRWLTDTWLVDVDTDAAGKAVLIALALSIIERHLLAERPAFICTAGQRGGGKTTALNMISMGVLGKRAAATSWSDIQEERRKALFSILMEGAPFTVFDNIKRGTALSCPVIDASLTLPTMKDRVLGASRTQEVATNTILAFTGNTISARGDFASRSLAINIDVKRADAENRDFVHGDPMEWTLSHRHKILKALFRVLMVDRNQDDQAPTRFKGWWRLVGQPIEIVSDIKFADLFAQSGANDEEAIGAATLYAGILEKKGLTTNGKSPEFTAVFVAGLMNWSPGPYSTGSDPAAEAEKAKAEALRGALEEASGSALPPGPASSLRVGRRLKALDGRVVDDGNGDTLVLRARIDGHLNSTLFWIERLKKKTTP